MGFIDTGPVLLTLVTANTRGYVRGEAVIEQPAIARIAACKPCHKGIDKARPQRARYAPAAWVA